MNLITLATAMVPALLQGQVDASRSIDAYQILNYAGAELTTPADNGVPDGQHIDDLASNAYIKDNPDVVKKFIAAS
jgi:ABC-type nitrate/sulfonate/bicarbonate transport system substrate-binding protein